MLEDGGRNTKRLKVGLPVGEKKKFNMIDLTANKGKLIEKFFMVAVVLSYTATCSVGVNYDMSEYLPSYAPSKEGLNLMEEEFGYPGTVRVMVGPVSLYEAKIHKDKIATVNGVDMVTWADTTIDIYGAQHSIGYENIEDYYRDEYAMMGVIFEEGDSSKLTKPVLNEMKIITGDRGHFMGSVVQNKSPSEALIKEISVALVIGVIMIAVILCLTTTPWFEPVLLSMVMGIAIIIDVGINLMIGMVSFVTFGVAFTLQLAIVMDYSVFLLYSFTKMKLKELPTEEAMVQAIRNSLFSILVSGATIIVGFIMLTLMRSSIGRDLGFVLARGTVISLMTVLFLISALILRFNGLIERAEHKSFVSSLHKMGNFAYKTRYVVLAIMTVLVIPMFVVQNMNQSAFGNSALGSSPGMAAYEDEQTINSRLGKSNPTLATVPNTDMVMEWEMSEEIDDLYYIKLVTSPAGILSEGISVDFLPESMTSMLHTEDYSRILIYVRTEDENDFVLQCPDEIKGTVMKCYSEGSYVTGTTSLTQDIWNIIMEDYGSVNILSVIGVALVVAVTFRSAIVSIIVLISIEVAIFLNMVIPYLTGDATLYIEYIIVNCLQLGAMVDYSVLMTNNYMDARKEYPNEKTRAVKCMVLRSVPSTLTFGSVLIIVGYGPYKISSVTAIGDLGYLIGRGASVSVILVLLLPPTLLVDDGRWLVRSERKPKKPIKERWRETAL